MLPLVELRLLHVTLSQLRPRDKELPMIEMKVGDVLRALELRGSSEEYEKMRKAVDGLMSRVIRRPERDGWVAYNFFRTVRYIKSRDVLQLRFNEEIRELLIDLQGFFHQVGNADIAKISSEYGVRLFQLIMSWKDKAGADGNAPGCWWYQIEIAHLKKLLMIPDTLYAGPDGTTNFKRFVINNPIKKINAAALGVHIDVAYLKKGIYLHAVRFDCRLVGHGFQLDSPVDKKTLALRKTARWKEIFRDLQAQAVFPGFETMTLEERRVMDELKADRIYAEELRGLKSNIDFKG
jgi:plasmid replication initiation protein